MGNSVRLYVGGGLTLAAGVALLVVKERDTGLALIATGLGELGVKWGVSSSSPAPSGGA
jgi:hypothetical protein